MKVSTSAASSWPSEPPMTATRWPSGRAVTLAPTLGSSSGTENVRSACGSSPSSSGTGTLPSPTPPASKILPALSLAAPWRDRAHASSKP
ncbi:hypothetical protein [Stigmatella aurantiaca]|uniref:hypothetical protein n=1 Tax=Stigmatella aurantiaca TaxID=41 RepID=UPI0015A6A1E8|nr:hypothetical protein [Stigmatella aurantiaca]